MSDNIIKTDEEMLNKTKYEIIINESWVRIMEKDECTTNGYEIRMNGA